MNADSDLFQVFLRINLVTMPIGIIIIIKFGMRWWFRLYGLVILCVLAAALYLYVSNDPLKELYSLLLAALLISILLAVVLPPYLVVLVTKLVWSVTAGAVSPQSSSSKYRPARDQLRCHPG